MDNFNLQGYMASGKLHSNSETLTEAKKQGYDDREDESLGARKGAEKGKKQSMKDRRDDSYGKFGKRDAEKKGKNKINKENLAEKEDSKKGNESEQKRMEGAIKDDRDHIKNLKKDIEDNERKLARLKKDYKKDVIKEDEGNTSELYSVMRLIFDLVRKYDLDAEDVMDELGEEFNVPFEFGRASGMEENIIKEEDEEMSSSKMKVSELKAKIKENILAELSLSEAEEDVDVDIDVEDEVEVEAGADDIEIERPGVKTTVDVGLSPEEEVVQDSLKAAMDAAEALGSDKLADQIGNTITFFTRQFVVGDRDD